MDYPRIYTLLQRDYGYCHCLFYTPFKANYRYNLEQLDGLSVEESELLKETSRMHLFTNRIFAEACPIVI